MKDTNKPSQFYIPLANNFGVDGLEKRKRINRALKIRLIVIMVFGLVFVTVSSVIYFNYMNDLIDSNEYMLSE